jgi:hypothetical protein
MRGGRGYDERSAFGEQRLASGEAFDPITPEVDEDLAF